MISPLPTSNNSSPACSLSVVRFALSLLIFFIMATTLYAADVVLIANINVPVQELSRHEVKNIFLSKITTVADVRIKPVMLQKNDLTDQFLKESVGKTSSQFSNYYKKLIFTGRGRPPKKTASETDMLAYVSSTRGAIGYVSPDSVTDTVRVIQVTK